MNLRLVGILFYVRYDMIQVVLENGGIFQIGAQLAQGIGVIEAVAEALVRDDSDAHQLSGRNAAVPFGHGLELFLADGYKDSRRTEIVQMMIDEIRLDRFHIGNEARGVEGTCLEDLFGTHAVLVQKFDQSYAHLDERIGHIGQHFGSLIGIVVALQGGVFDDRLVYGLFDLVDILIAAEGQLDGRAYGVVAQSLFDGKADLDIVPAVDPAVHDKAVNLRPLGKQTHHRRNHDVKVGDAYAVFFPIAGDKLIQNRAVGIVREGILRVASGLHNVGNDLLKRFDVLDFRAVASSSEHKCTCLSKYFPFY